jgi:hypothetical protein
MPGIRGWYRRSEHSRPAFRPTSLITIKQHGSGAVLSYILHRVAGNNTHWEMKTLQGTCASWGKTRKSTFCRIPRKHCRWQHLNSNGFIKREAVLPPMVRGTVVTVTSARAVSHPSNITMINRPTSTFNVDYEWLLAKIQNRVLLLISDGQSEISL